MTDRDVAALLRLRARLMRLALVADRYGEDLADFDAVQAPAAGTREAGGRRRRRHRVVRT